MYPYSTSYVSLCLPLVRNVQHIPAYVHPKPHVSGFFQSFPAETATAPNIQNEARLFWLRRMSVSRVEKWGTAEGEGEASD